MTKPQSPRSRLAGSFGAATDGRDGRSFFSRPKGDARKPAPRDRSESGDRARDDRGGDRGGYGQERGEARGGDRNSYGQDRREGQGRPDSRSSFGGQHGEARGGDRHSYGQDRREGQGRPDSRSYDSRASSGPRGEYRGGDHAPQKPQSNRPRLSHGAIRIDQVQRVLGEILQWTYPADAALSHWLRSHPNLGARDRSEVAEAVYDVLRHLRRYRPAATYSTKSGGCASTDPMVCRTATGHAWWMSPCSSLRWLLRPRSRKRLTRQRRFRYA